MKFWIVKGNPEINELTKMLVPGKNATWYDPSNQAKNGAKAGDGIFFWSSGRDRFLIGLGEMGDPFTSRDGSYYLFDLIYLTEPFSYPVTLVELKQDPLFNPTNPNRPYFMIPGPVQTRYPLTGSQAQRLADMILAKNPNVTNLSDILARWFPTAARGSPRRQVESRAEPKPRDERSIQGIKPAASRVRRIDTIAPTAFISYSWDDDEHRHWVRELAVRLRGDGVDVKLDHWELAPGDQLPAFMERSVRESNFVLIICTPQYKRKADGRQGGVGYEDTVMTGEVYSGANWRKFIPILRREEWTASAPSWLQGSYRIDLRGDPYQAVSYVDLLDTMHGRRHTAPPLGNPPDQNQSRKEDMPARISDDPAGDDYAIIQETLRAGQRALARTPSDPRYLGLGGGKVRKSKWL